MSRHAYDDDNFETVTGRDGKPSRILKDRGRVRISMTMRDSLPPLQRSIADDTARDYNRITDGRSDDPTALNRPGFRVPLVNDWRAVTDAYAKYQAELTNAYRRVGDGETQCPESEGGYHSANPAERRVNLQNHSDAQTIRDHRQTMDQLYRERDAEMANAWRGQ